MKVTNVKRILTILLSFCALQLCAQEVVDFIPEKGVIDSTAMSPDFMVAPRQDSLALSLPALTSRGTIAHYPYLGSLLLGGYNDWSLHPGVNASLSASAIIGLGRHSGSGFANSFSLMYADNITPKLSFALGGYYSFLDYSGHQLRDAGLTAMLNYRFDEHWEAAAFVQKSIMQPKLPPQLYWMSDVGDKIGASLRYNFNPAFSVSVSLWEERNPRLFAPTFSNIP